VTAAFKVGDVATGQAFVYNTEYNGMDCEIIAPLASYWAKHPAGHTRVAQFYRVRWPDGSVNLVRPIHLRPKKPAPRNRHGGVLGGLPVAAREGADMLTLEPMIFEPTGLEAFLLAAVAFGLALVLVDWWFDR